MTTTNPPAIEPAPPPEVRFSRPDTETLAWRVVAILFLLGGVATFVHADVRYVLAGISAAAAVGCYGVGESRARSSSRRDADARLRQSIDSGFERLARAIEASANARPAVAAGDPKAERLAEVRRAIREAAWGDAVGLVREYRESFPDDVRAEEGLAAAREFAVPETLAKLAAARAANDPDRVIELRDAIKPLLEPDPLRVLDRDLAKWMMGLIQRRLRGGKVTADVPTLAAKVAASLDETPEGASLRASLPTLRRAAGLCPRCAQPFTGIEDACPQCLSGPAPQLPPVEAN